MPAPFYYRPGYIVIDSYPWWIYNGYRYRYNPVEMCQYELVDSSSNTVVHTYGEMSCNAGYDVCANDRDNANDLESFERFFCAERVEDEYSNQDDTVFSPIPNEISVERQVLIDQYLATRSNLDAYNDAVAKRLGTCTVWKLRGNPDGCTYRSKVDGVNYPDVDGEVCSAAQQAELIGCNVGTEKENVGCILKHAVQNGYCI